MDNNTIEINELRIRVSGTDAAIGEAFGQQVAEKLSAGMPPRNETRLVPELKIVLDERSLASNASLAERIAEEIIRKLSHTRLRE